ncbi:MAG: PEP-CTERM sorting domain-containing protein [Cyanobacteria bacterium P01_H01_bin.162]
MNRYLVPGVVGAATVAIVATMPLATPAVAAEFAVDSGVTRVFLDFENVLSPLGINLVTASEDALANGMGEFQVGFDITDDTDFMFDDGLTAPMGTIRHTGSITLDIGGTEVTVGDFDIGLRDGGGIFVRDTLTTGAILFDFEPTSSAADESSLALNGNLLVSPEFSGLLSELLADPKLTPALTGAAVGRAHVDADLVGGAASVPEPLGLVGMMLAGTGAIASRRWLR